jgi:hypothetical protein
MIKTRGKRRINLSIFRQPLTWSPKPRDEKSVGAVVRRRQQSAGTIQTPSGKGRFLHLP